MALVPGDNVLFKRGDSFYGSLTITSSGSADNPITFSAYGSGSQPIITGFTVVTGWTNLGNNIWESVNQVSSLSKVNLVTIDGLNTAMGRYPNPDASWGGYLKIDSHSSTTAITSSGLDGVIDWTGAEAAIRNAMFLLNRTPINSQSGNTINLNSNTTSLPDGYGFFIQNDPRTLDRQNEWYYDAISHKIKVYSIGQPGVVKVASINRLITVNANYLNFDNLEFSGANEMAFYAWDHNPRYNHVNIINNTIHDIGISAIYVLINYLNVENNNISKCNSGGVNITYGSNVTVKNNDISDILQLIGMRNTAGYGGAESAISSNVATNFTVERNTIRNVGYIGISFYGDSTLVKNNLVDTYCNVLDDGGGIYTYTGNRATTYNNAIIGNIVINGVGAPNGVKDSFSSVRGIYLDQESANVEVADNSVYKSVLSGIYISSRENINVHDNTVFDGGSYSFYSTYWGDSVWPTETGPTGNKLDNNIFVCRNILGPYNSSDEKCVSYYFVGLKGRQGKEQVLMSIAHQDYNYYLRGHFDGKAIRYNDVLWDPGFCTLSEWQTFSGTDLNSHYIDLLSTTNDDLKFVYNASLSTSTISLTQPMVDSYGTQYASQATIAPYSSLVLMKDLNSAPIDNVGPVIVNFSIPTTASSLKISNISFSATDEFGVSGYLLSEIASLPSPSSSFWSSTPITTYTFSSSGTHTLYAFAKDAAGNISTAASSSVIITLPTSGGGGGSSGGGSSSGGGASSNSNSSVTTTANSSTSATTTSIITSSTPIVVATSTNNAEIKTTDTDLTSISRATAIEAAAAQLVSTEKNLVSRVNKTLSTNLAGRLLLQVESHGEAWYLNPANKLKYYLGTPAMAFSIMRSLGQGISNANLSKIKIADANLNTNLDTDGDGLSDAFEDAIGSDKTKADTDGDGYSDKTELINDYNFNGTNKLNFDTSFTNNQQGKIFLQVESHGEAWYVNPLTKLRYYLGRPEDAYSLMRSLSLGISNDNLRQIGVGEVK